MATWPTGWQAATLRAAGIPKTQFALDVLSAWQQSTPTAPWTNNPLGIPAKGSGAKAALNTPYAAFATIGNFRTVFKRLMSSGDGKAVTQSLIEAQSYAATWRDIHALSWPGNRTESEYPVKLMDLVTAAYEEAARKKAAAKTASPTTQAPKPASQQKAKASQATAAQAAITGMPASPDIELTREASTTSGDTVTPPDVHSAMHHQALLLHHAATSFSTASDAIAFIMRGSQ